MSDTSTTTTTEQRDPRGRFAPGNKLAHGNPHAKRVQALRSALLAAVSTGDVKDIIRAMIVAARTGDVQAAKLVLDRVLGEPLPLDVMEEIENLRTALQEIKCYEREGQN